MYTIQTTGTAQGLLACLSTLTFRLDNADYRQFQTETCKSFPRIQPSVVGLCVVTRAKTTNKLSLKLGTKRKGHNESEGVIRCAEGCDKCGNGQTVSTRSL